MKTIIKTAAMSIVLLLMALMSTNALNAQSNAERVYIKIEVDGLSCPFCAYGLEKKLKKVAGSENVFITLEEGEATMSVPKDQAPTEEKLQKIVKDAGFTPRKITFSKMPFKTKKDEK